MKGFEGLQHWYLELKVLINKTRRCSDMRSKIPSWQCYFAIMAVREIKHETRKGHPTYKGDKSSRIAEANCSMQLNTWNAPDTDRCCDKNGIAQLTYSSWSLEFQVKRNEQSFDIGSSIIRTESRSAAELRMLPQSTSIRSRSLLCRHLSSVYWYTHNVQLWYNHYQP